ncbi:MAG: hypothetical protein WCQ60_04085 [bacterium]
MPSPPCTGSVDSVSTYASLNANKKWAGTAGSTDALKRDDRVVSRSDSCHSKVRIGSSAEAVPDTTTPLSFHATVDKTAPLDVNLA